MSTFMKFRQPPVPVIACAALLLSVASAMAQSASAGSAEMPNAASLGQGAGYHDPRSPFKPLQEVDGVVSWKLLSAVTTKADKTKVVPTFPNGVLELDKRTVKVQGRPRTRCGVPSICGTWSL